MSISLAKAKQVFQRKLEAFLCSRTELLRLCCSPTGGVTLPFLKIFQADHDRTSLRPL